MILTADARALPLSDRSIDCIVTSPPYWAQRDYGHNRQIGLEDSPSAYVGQMTLVGAEMFRVLRDHGTLWFNVGDTIFGDSPVRRNGAETFSGEWDPSLTRSRGGTRRSAVSVDGLLSKSLSDIPSRLMQAFREIGWRVRSQIIWTKPKARTEGRVSDRPIRAYEFIFLLAKSRHYKFDVGQLPTWAKTDVWNIPVESESGHVAAFPDGLVVPCILASTSPGDLVLDPFLGSGTTGRVANRLGRRWVGSDLSWASLAKERTRDVGLPLGSWEEPA